MAFSPRSNKERKSRFSIDPDLSAISKASPTRALSQRQRSRAPPIPAREVRLAERAASLPRDSLLSGNPLIQAGLSNRVITELLALDRARKTQAKARERAGESAERFAPTFTEAQLEKKARMEARAAWEKRIQDLEQKLIDSWDDYLSYHYEKTGEELKDKDPDFLKMAQNEVGPFFFHPKTKKPSFKPTSPLSAREIFSKGIIYKGKGRRRGSRRKSMSDSESDEEMRGCGLNEDIFDLRGLADGSMYYSQLSDRLKNAIRDIEVTPATFYPFPSSTLEEIYLDLGPDNDENLAKYLKVKKYIINRLIKTYKSQSKSSLNPDAEEYKPRQEYIDSGVPDYSYNDRADTEFMGLPPTVMSVVNAAEPDNVDSFAGMGHCYPRFHSREYHGRGRLGFMNPLPGSTRGF